MCLSLASNSSEPIKVIIIKVDMVIASDMRMHHVLIILTKVTLIKIVKIISSIILETFQAMPIKFALKIVRWKVYIIFSQSDDLGLHSRSEQHLKRDTFKLVL